MIDTSTPKAWRVLHITRNLPPLRGGMERLNLQMALEVSKDFDLTVIGPNGCRKALASNIAVEEVAARPLLRFFIGAAATSMRIAQGWRPNVVLAGSGLTAPFAWFAAKLVRARMAVYVHGLDLIAKHPVFRWCWLPFIRRADLCVANSTNTATLARSIGVDSGRIVVVHPGVSLPPPEPGVNDFRERFELNGRPLLLSVGRLIARKGLLEFVENALPAIVAAHTDVCLIVLGEETPDLLQGNSIGLRTRILQRARDLGLTHNLRFIGPQDDNTLALAYRAADVHVFPVRDIPADVEGFGMVAIEAAAHGLPTVAFAVGGVPDAVNDGVSGTLVRPGDYAQFVASVLEWLGRRGDSGVRERASHFASQFSWALFGAQINENLRKLVQP